MKRDISRRKFLAAAACAAAAPGRVEAQVGPAVFVIACGVAAFGLIIYVTKKTQPPALHQFVLEKSLDHRTWTPVATNTLRMTVDEAWAAFEVDRVDTVAFYRVVCVPLGSPRQPNMVESGHERAVPQKA